MNKYIAIDGDGVLFDYNKAAAALFYTLYKENLKEIHPQAYNFHKQYDIEGSSQPEFMKIIYPMFDKLEIWGKMPGLVGALEATNIMKAKGYTLVCLTSMPPKYKDLRHQNAIALGYPIDHVVAVDRRAAKKSGINNPKKEWIIQNKPVAFIDDLLKNFIDMEDIKDTQLIWLDNKHSEIDNPNLNFDKKHIHQTIYSLKDFAESLPVCNINKKKP
jgi:hypothetical protein